jgi:cytidine deaminase
MGCNDVPRPGGGLYWEGEKPDRRDFTLGSDPNAIARKTIIGEVLAAMKPYLGVRFQGEGGEDTSDLASLIAPALKRTRISNLLEFGRVVHAEMNALMDAARRGVALKGATLYCTTFPCHMCARHILAAGIQRVVYIEPYPKSLAEEMYREAIVVDGCGSGDPDALRFDAFVGIAPRRFIDCFEALRRKDTDGYALRHGLGDARLRFTSIAQAHIERELACGAELLKVKDKLGLT